MNVDSISHSYLRSPSPIPPTRLPPDRSSSPSPPPPHHAVSFPSAPSLTASPTATTTTTTKTGHAGSAKQVPIRWMSLMPIMVFCVADAMTYSVLFPFVTDMITSFRVPQDKIGLYSGLGEGIMMLVEAANATNWARLGDKYGRRPCIIYGFAVTVFAMPIMGFSRAVWQLVLARAIMGMNPGGVLVKTSAAELSHPSNRDQIFSILSPSFSVGFLLGTFLGGELAHPYGRLPWWLGGTSEVWRDAPYGLPCMVIAGLDLVAILIAYFYLPETQRLSDRPIQTSKSRSRSELMQTFKVPTFTLAVVVVCLFQLCYFSWDGIFTVFTYTEPAKGGLGLPVETIGLLYSFESLISIVSNPLFLPKLQARFGPQRALGYVLLAWPVLMLSMPIAQWAAVNSRGFMWVVVMVEMTLRTFGNFAWAMTDIMIMAAFDDAPELMATGNAISLVASAGGRAFGPVIAGWLYSISTQFPTGSFGRQIAWIYLTLATIPGVILVWFFLPPAPPGKYSPGGVDGVSMGYEAVPLVEAEPDGDGDEDEDGQTSAVEWKTADHRDVSK